MQWTRQPRRRTSHPPMPRLHTRRKEARPWKAWWVEKRVGSLPSLANNRDDDDAFLADTINIMGADDPFIVLTETKFSIRYILVWARY